MMIYHPPAGVTSAFQMAGWPFIGHGASRDMQILALSWLPLGWAKIRGAAGRHGLVAEKRYAKIKRCQKLIRIRSSGRRARKPICFKEV